MVKLLLDYGVDVTVANGEGKTVFDRIQEKTSMSAEDRQELTALCKQYEEDNRSHITTTAPVLK